jgi:AAA family ATP:ADP antiporter
MGHRGAQRHTVLVKALSGNHEGGGGENSGPSTRGDSTAPSSVGAMSASKSIHQAIQHQLSKLDGLWAQLIPMTALFFMLAFVNTIIDSLKDSLVITAVGGGTEVLPYLSTYAVLPSSVLFLVLYSWATKNLSREKIFNIVVGCFMIFYAGFAVLYPHHEAMHSSPFADWLLSTLPNGFAGFVGMVRNWMFTAFYCVSELWGDVLLSLLFWGLANETTSIEDAPLLYPLFGIGANIAQTCAGRSLRLVGDVSAPWLTYSQQIQLTVAICVAMGLAIVGVHTHIVRTFEKNPKGSAIYRKRRRERQAARAQVNGAADAANANVGRKEMDVAASVPGLNYCDLQGKQSSEEQAIVVRLDGGDVSSSASQDTSSMSIVSAWKYLIKSPQIKCLAVMAIAQGLTTRILEVSWKTYLHMMCPSPVEYAAFLGDVAAMTGVSTALLMVFSPLLFDLMGWVGVASATPNIMIIGGIPFFIACMVYSFGGVAVGSLLSLKTVVIAGAVLHVFARGAKFSLFKPSEEMVYIGLDDESRTKGKAAIDVVGAQSGKSLSSILQQFLLIFMSGGSVSGIIPVLGLTFVTMLGQWKRSIRELAEHGDPARAHRMSVMASIDDGDIEGSAVSNVPASV